MSQKPRHDQKSGVGSKEDPDRHRQGEHDARRNDPPPGRTSVGQQSRPGSNSAWRWDRDSKQYYYYDAQTDFIVFANGLRKQRPPNIPRSSFQPSVIQTTTLSPGSPSSEPNYTTSSLAQPGQTSLYGQRPLYGQTSEHGHPSQYAVTNARSLPSPDSQSTVRRPSATVATQKVHAAARQLQNATLDDRTSVAGPSSEQCTLAPGEANLRDNLLPTTVTQHNGAALRRETTSSRGTGTGSGSTATSAPIRDNDSNPLAFAGSSRMRSDGLEMGSSEAHPYLKALVWETARRLLAAGYSRKRAADLFEAALAEQIGHSSSGASDEDNNSSEESEPD